MTVRVAINGFGRIGRLVMRSVIETGRTDIEVVAINGSGPVETNAHLLKYDSVHGRLNADIKVDGDTMDYGRGKMRFSSLRDPKILPWQDLDVDVVMECTGAFNDRDKAAAHLENGSKRVLVSAPATNADLTVVYGINHDQLTSDHVIAISDYDKSQIETYFKKFDLSDKMTVIHRGVDDGYFDASAVKQGRTINEATRLALPDDRPVVMMPARPTAWKGHAILLQAVSQMPDKEFTLVLLGIGDATEKYYDHIESLVRKLGLESMVRLARKSSDMPASMMLADVVVMPSIEPEPFGRVAIEAQAMGRPVVAFDHGGACESITDEETGFLAVPNDAASLAKKISQALALGPRQRKKFGAAARAHIEREFTVAAMCEKTVAIYDDLLKKQ